MKENCWQEVRCFLRAQRPALACGVLLTAIGSLLSLAALYPQDTLAAFCVPEEAGLFPLIIVSMILAGACFLTAGWWILSWMFRQLKGFGSLEVATQATVTTEFLLALPVLIYLYGTVFQMGEIAHAQLVFRYAAFSAARAGSVSNKLLPWLPKISMQVNADGNNMPMIYFIDDEDKARMRTAAAVALSGLDTHKATHLPTGMVNVAHDGLAYHYYQAGERAKVRRSNLNPWIDDSSFFGRQLRDANSAIVTFDPQCEYSKLFPSDIRGMITNQINPLLDQNSVTSGGGPLDSLFSAVGISSPREMIQSVMDSLITKILVDTGL